MKLLKNNNKGLTLVELIVAAAILGAISVPLLSMFIVASRTTITSREIGDGTAIVENILEQYESTDLDNWLDLGSVSHIRAPQYDTIDGSFYAWETDINGIPSFNNLGSVMPMPELDDFTDINIAYQNVQIGNNEFDVLVTLNPGEENLANLGTGDSYWTINNIPLVSYTPMNYIYTQSRDIAQDPDAAAIAAFENEAILRGYDLAEVNIADPTINIAVDPRRTITMTVTEDTNPPPNQQILHTEVTYSYEFDFPGATTSPYSFEYTVPSFHITPADGVDANVKNAATFYLVYYPWYYGDITTKDTIVINKETTAEINVIVVKRRDPSISDAQLNSYERNYRAEVFLIQEYESDLYDIGSNKVKIDGNLLTNINDPLVEYLTYIYGTDFHLTNGSGTYSTTALDTGNDLIITEDVKRIYDIQVSIYDATPTGTPPDFTQTPIYTINSTI